MVTMAALELILIFMSTRRLGVGIPWGRVVAEGCRCRFAFVRQRALWMFGGCCDGHSVGGTSARREGQRAVAKVASVANQVRVLFAKFLVLFLLFLILRVALGLGRLWVAERVEESVEIRLHMLGHLVVQAKVTHGVA